MFSFQLSMLFFWGFSKRLTLSWAPACRYYRHSRVIITCSWQRRVATRSFKWRVSRVRMSQNFEANFKSSIPFSLPSFFASNATLINSLTLKNLTFIGKQCLVFLFCYVASGILVPLSEHSQIEGIAGATSCMHLWQSWGLCSATTLKTLPSTFVFSRSSYLLCVFELV